MSTFNLIRIGQTEAEPQMQFEPAWGCPTCHKNDVAMLVGRRMVEGCTTHKVFWLGALNAFSAPLAELEEQQRKDWAASGMEDFKQVSPWVLGMSAKA